MERIQNYGMRLILSKPAGTPSDGLRQKLRWLPLERRREMFRLFLVHRCVMKLAPLCLGERLRTNEEMGNRMTRGCHNLFVPEISTENYRRSFTFRGTWEWNKLPKDLKMVKSALTFKKVLKNLFQQLYFAEVV